MSTSLTFLNSLRRVSGRAGKVELRPYEVAAILLLALSVVALGVYYFVLLGPERSKVDKLRQDIARNDATIQELRSGKGTQDPESDNTKASLSSLQEFDQTLQSPQAGQSAIIAEVNDLARKNHIGITDSLKFTKIEEAAADSTKLERRSNASIYPGLALDLGVQGTYENLRNFISQLENSRNFIILKGVELEGIEPQEIAEGGRRSNVRNKQEGVGTIELVALRLRLDAYFKR
jgi:hypothetical protein